METNEIMENNGAPWKKYHIVPEDCTLFDKPLIEVINDLIAKVYAIDSDSITRKVVLSDMKLYFFKDVVSLLNQTCLLHIDQSWSKYLVTVGDVYDCVASLQAVTTSYINVKYHLHKKDPNVILFLVETIDILLKKNAKKEVDEIIPSMRLEQDLLIKGSSFISLLIDLERAYDIKMYERYRPRLKTVRDVYGAVSEIVKWCY